VFQPPDLLLIPTRISVGALSGEPVPLHYGHPDTSTDPRGVVTAFDYDNADRPVATTWSRGPAGPDAPRACRTSGPADSARYGPNITLCTAATTYDGLDQVTASSDGNAQVSTYSYDALARRTATVAPRTNNNLATVRTEVRYDRDGQPLTVCTPRTFAPGGPGTCTSTDPYATQLGYDVAGRRASTTTYRDASTPLTATWTYDADGNTVTATDPNAHTTTTGTDLLDRPLSVTRPRDASTTYTVSYRYDPVGNRTSVTTPVDATTSRTDAYAYDADNRTTDRVQGADNPDALLAGTPSSDGGANIRTRTLYDADGRPVAAYGPRAFTASTTSPDPRFLTRTDIDADGRPTVKYTPRYDTANTGRTDDPTGTGGTQAAECPTGANPAPVPVPASMPTVPGYPATVGVCVTRTGYDPAGLAVTTTLPTAGGAAPGTTARQLSTAYTDDRLPVALTAPSPTGSGTVTTRTRYDAVGQPLSVTDPLGAVTTTSYTSDNLLAGTTAQGYTRSDGTPVAHSTAYGYDADGQRTAVTNPLGQTATTAYTADGLVASAGDTGGGLTRYSYDQVGNPTSVWSPSANSADETNPAGIPTVNTYTADDLPATTLQPPSTDGLRRRTTWTYDTGGRKTRQTHDSVDPASGALTPGGAQTFAYYPDSRLAASTGRGDSPTTPEVIRTVYDPAGSATRVTDSTGGGSTITSSYYLDGQPRTVDNGTETTAAAYDGAGQPARRQQGPAAGPPATSSYVYTDAGTPSSSTSSTVGASAATPWAWAFDAAGRKTREDTPEGQSTTSSYNPDDTLAQQETRRGSTPATALVSQWRYTYDNLTRQLTGDNTAMMPGDPAAPPRSQRHTFGYDTTGRLTAYTDDRGPHTIGYDRDGNRLSYSTPTAPGQPPVTQRSHYNPDDSIKDATDGTPANPPSTSTYRAAGVLGDDGCYTYSFDGFDRLNQARPKTGSACASAPSSSTTSYAYDGLDRQRRTDVTTKTTTTTVNPDGTLATSTGQDHTVTATNYDGLSSTVASETDTTTPTAPKPPMRYALDTAGASKSLTWQQAATGGGTTPATQYLTDDGFGTITTITGATNSTSGGTATGYVACATRFDPWGRPRTDSTPGTGSGPPPPGASKANTGLAANPCPTSKTDSTPTTPNDTYYRSQRRDTGTGTYQLGSRTYDPSKAAFLSQDTYRDAPPQGDLAVGTDPLTQNRYTYVNGDPVNLTDPDGHCAARGDGDLCPNQGSGGQARARDNQGRVIGTNLNQTERLHNTVATHRETARAVNITTQRESRRRLAAANPGPPKVQKVEHHGCSGFLDCVGGAITTGAKYGVNAVAGAGQGVVNGAVQFGTLGIVDPHLNYCPVGDSAGLRSTCSQSNRIASDGTQIIGNAALAVGTGGASEAAQGAALAARAGRAAEAGSGGVEDAAGIVYRRIDAAGGKPYVGQAKSDARFLARQAEHARANLNADFEFEIIGRANPGTELDRLEEYYIRQGGGPTNRGNPAGRLANLRHQMSDSRYADAGGDYGP